MTQDIPLIDIADEAGRSFAARLDSVMTLEEVQQTELADFAQVTDRAIRGWTHGVIPFRSNLRSIEEYTGFTTAFFLAGHPTSHVESLNYWARASAPKYVRSRFAAFASVVGEATWQIQLEAELSQIRLTDTAVQSRHTSESAAAAARAEFGLADRPVDVLSFVEELGVMVTFGPPEILNVDAYSAWVDGRPLIVLNPHRADPVRALHAVAHELGHLLMHRVELDSSLAERVDREKEAEAFARAFLVPDVPRVNDALQRAMRSRSWDALTRLSRIYRVSGVDLFNIATSRRLERPEYLAERAIRYNAEHMSLTETDAAVTFRGPDALQSAIERICEFHHFDLDSYGREIGIPAKYLNLIAAHTFVEAGEADRSWRA